MEGGFTKQLTNEPTNLDHRAQQPVAKNAKYLSQFVEASLTTRKITDPGNVQQMVLGIQIRAKLGGF